MRQISDFNDTIANAANSYVSAYLQMDSIREKHLQFMQVLDRSPDFTTRELAEAIDLLLWEHDQQQTLDIAQEMDAWAADHEQWTAIY